jgi:carbamoyl-phosphate synthase small subunit
MQNQKPAFLVLEDGTTLEGISFGATGTRGGEICFNTGMTGYQEVFTDPSYTGQVLVMNNAYVGNYGVNEKDIESDTVTISALVCKNISDRFSRMTAAETLEQYLIAHDVVAIHGVDTRALVQHIRTKGAMNGIVTTETLTAEQTREALQKVPKMEGLDLASGVGTKEIYFFGTEDAPYRVAVLDFGVKRNILQCLTDKGGYLKVFPANTPAEDVLAFNPDGIFVSNGPGDPAAMEIAAQKIRILLESGIPLFGICLGHQLLARASGIKTYKMHHGHRGLNHPVKNLQTGLSEITTQNHGFVVDAEAVTASGHAEVTHINLNDGSVEGIRRTDIPAFSVQYHPESTPGSHDSRYLFDDFFALIKSSKQ